MIIIAGVVLLSLGVIAYCCYTAPEGYQDEKGFHYGRPEDKE